MITKRQCLPSTCHIGLKSPASLRAMTFEVPSSAGLWTKRYSFVFPTEKWNRIWLASILYSVNSRPFICSVPTSHFRSSDLLDAVKGTLTKLVPTFTVTLPALGKVAKDEKHLLQKVLWQRPDKPHMQSFKSFEYIICLDLQVALWLPILGTQKS